MANTLSEQELRQLYASYRAPEEWCETMLGAFRGFHGQNELLKRTPESQEQLWRIRGVGSVGIGSGVPVSAVFDDAEVVERILALPELAAKTPGEALPQALQAEFDALIEMIVARTGRNRPMALLSRVFLVLLPEHLNSVFNYGKNRRLGRLLLSEPPSGQIAVRVAVRRRLRTVLGREADLEESVRRITFCWWLAEQSREELESAASTFDGDLDSAAKTTVTPAPDEDDLDELKLSPFTKQLMGWPAVRGYADTYRAAVKACVGGASRDDVAEALAETPELASYAAKSLRNVVSRVRRLGLVETREGVLWPTDAGWELLEVDPPEVLTETMFRDIYGFAQLLRIISSGPIAATDAYDALCREYPRWTTHMAPSALESWLRHLGLIERDAERRLALTEYGELWHRRLPSELPAAPDGFFDEVEPDVVDVGVETTNRTTRTPTVVELRDAIRDDPKLADFVLDETHLASLHAAWHGNSRKRFVIFSGLSGTGKTALMRHYAHAYCRLANVNPAEHITLVAVSPDWRDPTGLLGYFNALHADPTYQAEAATRLLVRAAKNPGLPYFLLLDEMNLARVERYLAPLLSAMETGDPVALHAHDEPVNGVPPRVRWPAQLFIGGTVNMDESTHGFSDKVLDRAFTLEFWDVDLPGYFDKRAVVGGARQVAAENALARLHDVLRPVRRHFGYRAANEVLHFVERAAGDGLLSESEALDQAVFSKVLPRLRGTDLDGFDTTLAELAAVLGSLSLVRSEAKVRGMLDALSRTGVTKFFA